ncbi:hypothetical protein D3C84_868000 [compost metagenome]
MRIRSSVEMLCPNNAWMSASLTNFTASSGSFPALTSVRLIVSVSAGDASRLPYLIERPDSPAPSKSSMLFCSGQPGSSTSKRGTCSMNASGTSSSTICPGSFCTYAQVLKRSIVSVSSAGGGSLTTCSRRNRSSSTPLAIRICSSVASDKSSTASPRRRMSVVLPHSTGRSSSVFHTPAPSCSSVG